MTSISAINTFSLLPGVTVDEFETFSRELDRPVALGLGPVSRFEVYLVEGDETVDVVEVMTVTSWAEWETARDGAEQMRPVVERFDQLVDPESVRTYLSRRSPDAEEAWHG